MGRDDVSVRNQLRIAQIITDYHMEFKQKSVAICVICGDKQESLDASF